MHFRILKGISLHNDPPYHLADTNSCFLVLTCRIFEFRIAYSDIFGFPLNINPESRPFRTIIANHAILDKVAAAAAKFIFLITKKDSNFSITFDHAPSDNVVRVTMPDTDSESAVPGQNAIGRQAVGNTPAKVYPLAIARGYAVSKDGPLGAASRMESEVGVIYCLAVLKLDIITNLEAEAVSIVIS